MLLEKQIKDHVKTNFISSVIKQIPPNYDPAHGLLTLSVRVDFIKTVRSAKEIASFIVGNFVEFSRLVETSILEMMEEAHLCPPAYGLNLSFTIQNCSLPRHNLESIEFLSSMFEQSNGILVYLKDCRVLQVSQPELYLTSWTQVWERSCSCQQKIECFRRKQSLIEIVKSKSRSLKERVVTQIPRCSQCSAKLKFSRQQDQVFINCQKLSILSTMKSSNSKEEIFQRGELDIYLDHSHTSLLSLGDTIDICAYFSAQPFISKCAGKDLAIRVGRSAFLVSYYQSARRTSLNNAFFSKLSSLRCEYIHCPNPRDDQSIVYNFKKLMETVNQIKFPYLYENNLSTMKMSVLASLFSQLYLQSLHLMIITEEVSFIQKSLKLQGVSLQKWPSLYDNQSLITFIAQCHNSVILITNPLKKDFQYINYLLEQKIMKNVNFTLWIVGEPNSEYKKQLQLQKIDIIIDLSVQKNFNICRNIYDSMTDQRLEGFTDKTNEILNTAVKEKKDSNAYQYYQASFEGVEQSQEEVRQQAEVADQLLQNYFLRAREYKHINANALKTIKKIASGLACFRSYLRQKGAVSNERPRPSVLDSILAIFMEEETSRSKYSSSNTLFSNEISKLMLNEQDCQLSFWNYDFEEEELGESRRMVSRETMFRSMVRKLIALIDSNQVW